MNPCSYASGHDQKRLCTWDILERNSMDEKGKNLMYCDEELDQPDYLLLRIYFAHDIDKDFRCVTSNRFYCVQAWIHPDEVYSTSFKRPNLLRNQVDPMWEEEVRIPIGEVDRVEDLKLNLELVRAVRMSDAEEIIEPGPSSLRWVVGRVRMSLDELEGNMWENKALRLMQRDGMSACGWKPEGFIQVDLKLE